MHGGSAPQVRAAAERRLAEQAAARAVDRYGASIDVDPGTALMQLLAKAYGLAAFAEQQLRDVPVDQIPDHPWRVVHDRELDRAARVAKDLVQLGLAERELRFVQRQAEAVVALVDAIVRELGHDPRDPEIAGVIRSRLLEIDGTVGDG